MHLNCIYFDKAILRMFCNFQEIPGDSTVSNDFNNKTECIHLLDSFPKASILFIKSQ